MLRKFRNVYILLSHPNDIGLIAQRVIIIRIGGKVERNKTYAKHFLSIAVKVTILAIILLCNSVAGTTQISSCTTISSPGTYLLNQDILNSPVIFCINITSSNVVLDGNNHTIDGIYIWNSITPTYGVNIYSSATDIANVTIKNLNVADWYYGIYSFKASNLNITNNRISSSGIGIRLSSFLFPSSSYNILNNNTVNSNSYGIYISGFYPYLSKYNTLTNNTVSSNGYGIILTDFDNSTLTNNHILNSDTGISFSSGNTNYFYHNNFVNNSLSAYSGSAANVWNADYPSGGNYWDDYNASDNFNGSNQDQPGSDGIGDMPYNISGVGSQDKYPLTIPYGSLPSIPTSISPYIIIEGTLDMGFCVVLMGDDSMTYELTNLPGNIPPFGSRIRIKAIRLFDVGSFCMQGIPLKVHEILPLETSTSNCTQCHSTYVNSVNSSMHNQAKNGAAPACTNCHVNYDTESGHNGFVVNESNTCRNCHIDNVSGFYEQHTGSSDCTLCHFANTTRSFSLNTSLFTHDHNLTIEQNFYEYNQSGMPVRTNGGVGAGMFPYYTCTLTCHDYNATTGVEGKIDEAARSWLETKHAQSLRFPTASDNKNNCAKCKSPLNYNESLKVTNPSVSAQDWQGIQCRVCHNLHDWKFPNNTGPGGMSIAFYNGTLSSLAGYAIYDKVNSPTELCEKCHNGVSHDSMFAGTHKDTAGFNCTNCHMNSTFNNELHKFEVKNTTSNVTGCEVCHKPEDHTFQFTNKHTGKVTCSACHDHTVDNNYGIFIDPSTNVCTTYKNSHGAPVNWTLHNLSKEVSCNKCHGVSGGCNQIIICMDCDFGCISCHTEGGSAVSKVNLAVFGVHANISTGVTDSDCSSCHFNTTGMAPGYVVQPGVNVYVCGDCHVNQTVQSPQVSEHYPGANISTTMNCEDCHNNSINVPDQNSTINTLLGNVSHYGTTTNLVHPTAGTDEACNNCHNSVSNKTRYGVQNKQVTIPHTSTGSCNECHVNSSSSADTLHNASIEMPVTTNCLACHTTYAFKYKAPNLTGTPMAGFSTCNGASCHGNDISANLDTLLQHNVDRTFAGIGGYTDTVYLNSQDLLIVTKGSLINITCRINDTFRYGGASRVGGAEYYIDVDPGQGKGIPMDATDGFYDALNGAWENVRATLDTSSLSDGSHTIYIRGMDIGKQWSAPGSANIIIPPFMGLKGTVKDSDGSAISGAMVSTIGANNITGQDGNYSLPIHVAATYNVTASKLPEYYNSTVTGVVVTFDNTTFVNFSLTQKPIGMISGVVSN